MLRVSCSFVGFLDIPTSQNGFVCVCLCHILNACFNCGKRRNPQLHAHMLRAQIRANYEERRGRQSGREGRGRPGLQLVPTGASLSHVSLSLLLYCKVL